MRRYNANTAKDMVEDEAGEFVRWEDHVMAVEAAREKAIRDMVAELERRLDEADQARNGVDLER